MRDFKPSAMKVSNSSNYTVDDNTKKYCMSSYNSYANNFGFTIDSAIDHSV